MPAAVYNGGPVLLVAPESIPTLVATELTRLHPGRIVVVGESAVVAAGVMTSLSPFAAGSVTRLSGADRYGTAAAISAATFPVNVNVVYLASGANYPDALAGGPAAGVNHAPVLLVMQSSIPVAIATELTCLHPKQIIVLGGSAFVSDGVMTSLAAYLAP